MKIHSNNAFKYININKFSSKFKKKIEYLSKFGFKTGENYVIGEESIY